jgi:glycosyltransferase involved in cell wall biosynthesis
MRRRPRAWSRRFATVADLSVSVVIPVRNGERFLAEALESVREQTLSPCEVIVVDDGSTDRTVEVGQAFHARVIPSDDRGVSAARNTGIAASRGDAIAFLDHDDLWVPRKLESQVAALEGDPKAAYVWCPAATFVESGAETGWIHKEILAGSDYDIVIPSALMVRRGTFEAIGGFASEFDVCEDLDWVLRARDAGMHGLRVEERLVRYRIHGGNTTVVAPPTGPTYLRVLRASVERRRAAAERGVHAG